MAIKRQKPVTVLIQGNGYKIDARFENGSDPLSGMLGQLAEKLAKPNDDFDDFEALRRLVEKADRQMLESMLAMLKAKIDAMPG